MPRVFCFTLFCLVLVFGFVFLINYIHSLSSIAKDLIWDRGLLTDDHVEGQLLLQSRDGSGCTSFSDRSPLGLPVGSASMVQQVFVLQ